MADHIRPAADVERDKFAAALAQMERMLPNMAKYAALDAQMKRARYLAFIAEGFDPQQALELCKVGP